MKTYFKNLIFLVMSFLIALAEVVILFSFPIILYKGTQNILYAGLFIILKPLMQALGIKLLKRIQNKINVYVLILIAFSLFYIIVILFNKVTNFLVLPLILILLGLSLSFFEVARMSFMKEKLEKDNNNDLFKVSNIVNIFAYIIGPIFAISLILKEDFYGIINYFAILIAVAGIIFYFFLRKTQKQITRLSTEVKGDQKIFKDLLFTEGIKGALVFIIPLYVFTYYSANNGVIYAIPAFFVSSLVIKILFKIFKVRFRKMSELVRVLMLSLGLFVFFFSNDNNYFVFACALLGVVIAVIENESSYQDRLRDDSLNHYYSTSIAIIVGVILIALLSYSSPVNVSLSVIGVMIIVFDFVLTLFKYLRSKRNKANTVA